MASDNKSIRVLFLSAWYPTSVNTMLGLFVERHAKAVSRKCKVVVLYIQPVTNTNIHSYKIQLKKTTNFYQIIVFYNNTGNIPVISPFLKLYRYLKAYRIGFRSVKKHFGRYDIIHVNILTRTGVVALSKKIFSRKPYIITEHWSRYLPNVNTYNGSLRKWLTKLVVKKASAVTTVTKDLKNAMNNHGLVNPNFHVVPNVVDTDYFNYTEKIADTKKVILHVSCFEDKSKNISGILRVIKSLSEKRDDFVCMLVGDGIDRGALESQARKLGIKDKFVIFCGLKEKKEIAEIYAASDFMILFSNYENMPVVIPEALASGLPVISTNVGGISEVINEENGFLVKPGDEAALEKEINFMLSNFHRYDREKLRQYAINNFSMDVVGESFFRIYSDILKK